MLDDLHAHFLKTLLQRIFFTATNVVPSWEEARRLLGAFDPEGEAAVVRCVAALAPVVRIIEEQLRAHGLADDKPPKEPKEPRDAKDSDGDGGV